MTLELLYHWNTEWSKMSPLGMGPENIELSRQQNWERVNQITKWEFIDAVSSIEYSIKKFAFARDEFRQLWNGGQNVYLRTVLNKSKELKPALTNEAELKEWNCILDIRNTVVHNNAVADTNETCRVGDEEITSRRGTMLQGKLTFFVNLTTRALDLFQLWTQSASSLK